ncbi:MAG: cytochrome P450 [Caldilinea sp. CFX5]|nr:cytochrome P450 [Caldilinea sp. CFX5]
MNKYTLFPIGATVTLAELEGDPHPLLHRLRATEPVSWLPAINGWLVTPRAAAIAVMRDSKSYTVDHPGFSTAQVIGPSMLSLDGVEHQRHRTPFERPFRLEAVQRCFRQPVADHIHHLLDSLVARGCAELRRDFAGPVAVKTMITALGLQETAVTTVLGWYDAIVDAVTRVTAGEPVSAEGQAAFAALHAHLLPILAQQPAANLLAAASGAGTGLSVDQIVANAAVLLFGGIETTEAMITNAFYHLLTNGVVLEAVRQEPTLLPAVVEESLRLEPAAAVVDRYATADVQLGNVLIRKDDLVRVSLTAANRDPATFADPDRFDPWRPNLRSHVTFAQGPHVCLGLHLARLEAQLALEQALKRLAHLRLIQTDTARQAAQPRGLVFRKPQALQVEWRRP